MEIAALARRAEAAFGAPQDIEWAIDGDGLHILQSRPITTPLLPEPNPDDTLTIYDNSNIVESYPGHGQPPDLFLRALCLHACLPWPSSPCSGCQRKTIEANSAVFGNMLGRVDGRVYYNLVNWYRALALLPGFSLNRSLHGNDDGRLRTDAGGGDGSDRPTARRRGLAEAAST
jgi:hypothetical protein